MTRIRRLLLWVAAPAAALLLLGATHRSGPPLFLINESPSLPEGVYLSTPASPLEQGAVVAVRHPPSAEPYLAALGMPRDTALLKRVAATVGDRVCARRGAIEVAGRRIGVQARDRLGRPLPRWSGCRVLAPGELFLLGDTPSSFDSRYFGPVSRNDVVGAYREFLLW